MDSSISPRRPLAFARRFAGTLALAIAVFLGTAVAIAVLRQPPAAPAGTPIGASPPDAGDPAAWSSLGTTYLDKARATEDPMWLDEAERAFRRSLALSPTADAMLGMSAVAAARHSFDESLAWSAKAKRTGGETAATLAASGDALAELGRYDEAFEAFDRLVAIKPGFASYARVSYARELRGDVGGAIRAMELAAQSAAQDRDRAFAAVQIGSLHWSAGRLGAAQAAFEHAARLDPANPDATLGRARIAAASGDVNGAITLVEPVVTRIPALDHLTMLHDLYLVGGRDDDAAALLPEMEEQRRRAVEHRVNLDVDWATIAADYRHVTLPGAVEAVLDEARTRSSVETVDAAAWALFAAGRPEEALPFAEEALRLGTRDAMLYFHRAMIEHALGDHAAAEQDLEAALDLNPHFSIRWAPLAQETLAVLQEK